MDSIGTIHRRRLSLSLGASMQSFVLFPRKVPVLALRSGGWRPALTAAFSNVNAFDDRWTKLRGLYGCGERLRVLKWSPVQSGILVRHPSSCHSQEPMT